LSQKIMVYGSGTLEMSGILQQKADKALLEMFVI
jgi:hypothetical protein